MLATNSYTRGRRRVKTRVKQIRRRELKESDTKTEFKTIIQQYKTEYLGFRAKLLEELDCKLLPKF